MHEQVRGDDGTEISLIDKPLFLVSYILKYCDDTNVDKDTPASSRSYLLEHPLS